MRTKICDIMSEMLDNPDENGIYQTSKFMSEMEDFGLELRNEAIGWTWTTACTLLDEGEDPRNYDQSQLISDAEQDLGGYTPAF